ncbi:FMN-dependent NADH-azoreductase, partial [Staphylococcus epidermidis]
MKGLIIIGSAQVGSHTNALSKYLKGQLGEHDVEVEIFDLAEKPIHQLLVLYQQNPIDEW